MNDLERRALLGDAEAQRECTEKGIVLACPFCGQEKIRILPVCGQGFIECPKCHCTTDLVDSVETAINHWNTRPAPPIGRCASCACWDENTCECVAAADIEVAYHRYTEPNFFCGDYEPKGGEENG